MEAASVTRQTAALALLAVTMGLLPACSDSAGPGRASSEIGAGLVVSQLVSQPAPASRNGQAPGIAAAVATGVVYVSLVPGTVPNGLQATVRDQANGQVVTTPVINGGFDPVALAASVGDTIVVVVTRAGSGPLQLSDVVRPIRPPRLVRTSPPPGGRDVPLNAVIVIVFSEPVDTTTLTTASVSLSHGATLVPGTVHAEDPVGFRVEFQPDSMLADRTEYLLVVSQAIRDVSGLPLDSAFAVRFTTGTQAQASGLVFASVSAGQLHSCGLTIDGTAYCWGDNYFGEIGDNTLLERLAPVPVMGGLTFATLSADALHNCGKTIAGAAYCWGDNSTGQLGDGDTSNRRSPVAVLGGITFSSVSAGATHSCGLTSAGVAFCWGDNSYGELGVGDTTMRTIPAQVVGALRFAQVSAGFYHTCGVTTTGSAYCWGANPAGQLGDGTTTVRTSPVAVQGGLTFEAVSAGEVHTCGVATAGSAYCWGNAGPVGDGVDTAHFNLTPVAVVGGLSFVLVSAGEAYTCGVTTAGLAYCWGSNETGELGDGTTTDRYSPVAVLGGLRFVVVSPGVNHTCGVTTTGAAYCWGNNDFGALGDGTNDSSFVPVPVAP